MLKDLCYLPASLAWAIVRMDEDYFSLQSILADNHVRPLTPLGTQVADQCLQKLSCSFTLDVPGLGYLEGGTEPNVCPLDEALHTFKLTIFRRG